LSTVKKINLLVPYFYKLLEFGKYLENKIHENQNLQMVYVKKLANFKKLNGGKVQNLRPAKIRWAQKKTCSTEVWQFFPYISLFLSIFFPVKIKSIVLNVSISLPF